MVEPEVLKAIAGAPDRPLVISGVEIPCYVLEDETRVLSQGGFLTAIGRAEKAKGGQGSKLAVKGEVDKLPPFLAAGNLKPFVSTDLEKSTTPIVFKAGQLSYGYRAEILPLVCSVYLEARDAGKLLPSQEHIAERADILIRGLATVGIVALVDEATGYQEIREKRALATILEKFIAKKIQPWTKTFPMDFYKEIFRLKQWPLDPQSQRPSVLGHYTNDVVYRRLAPGVLEQLQGKNPTLPTGRRAAHHHRWFTTDIGHPKLKEHLSAVIALMKVSDDWGMFQEHLATVFPMKHEQMPLFPKSKAKSKKDREPGLKADYKGSTPEEVAESVLKYRP